MKRKGFTLIELLATIVVIAIIALIAVPIILGVIDKAKKAAFEDSVKIANRQIEMYLFKNGLSEIPDDGIEVKDLDIKSNFTGGKFKNLNGTIIAEQIKNSEYCASGPIDNLVFSDPNDCISADELITDKPTFTYTVTSKSITAIVNETENSATFQYAFSKDNGANWTDMQVSNSFTFSDLETGTYNVKVRACDQINNCLDSESVSISTKKIDAPTYSISPDSGWAAKKTVTIDYPSGYTNEYSLDGGETWKLYSSPIEFTKTGTIIARVNDGKNYVTASSQTVAEIDSDKPTINPFTSTVTSKSITVTASGEDATSSISYAFSKDGGNTWTEKQIGNSYTFDDLETGTYNVAVIVYDQAGNFSEIVKESITTKEIETPTYSISPDSGWATKKTVTIDYPSGFTNEYSLDGGETWKPYSSPVEFTKSGTIIARVNDGKNYVEGSSQTVTQVDSDKPTSSTFTYVATSKAIYVTASGTDATSSISYAFSINNGSTWSNKQTSNEYVFDDLETGSYNVKVRVYDQAENYLDSTVQSIDTLGIETPTYSVSPNNGWATSKTVTINYPSGYTNEYSLDGGETWKPYTAPVEFTKTGTIIARVNDGKNYVTASSQTVSEVDSDKPTSSTFTYTRTSKSITVTASGSDATSSISYAFSNDNGSTWTEKQTSNEYTFNELLTGTYKVKVRVYDQANNYLDSDVQDVETMGINVPTYSVSPNNGWATSKTVTINYPSGYTNEYSLDGGETWKPYSSPVEFTKSGTIIARVNDGKNYVKGSSQTVSEVDSDKPTSSTFTYTKTSKAIYVTASGADATSSISYAFSSDNGNTWSATQTSNEYVFDDLETGSYNVKVRVYDQANNYLDSTAQNIETVIIATPTYSISPADGWATSKTVTINYPSGYTNEYSLDGGETWEPYTAPVNFIKTGTIIARVNDGKNYVEGSSQTITQVDSDKPTSSTFTYTRTSKSITAVASGTDATSNIVEYAFSSDNGNTWTTKQTANSYTFNELLSGTYNIKVRVYDQAGNYLDSTAQSISTVTIDKPTYSVNPSSGWAMSKTVTINYPSGYTNEYSLDGAQTWHKYTGPIVLTDLGATSATVVARVTDGKNYITGDTLTVTEIYLTTAQNVTFTPDDASWEVDNVYDALEDLRNRVNNF